jgi:4a-hydroxytetrahydrobiopterin dehydratase
MDESTLTAQHCEACEGGTKPMTPSQAQAFMPQVPGWSLSADGLLIERDFLFKDFKEAMAFINKVADLAESEGHHPNIHCWWNKVKLESTTHAVGGLSNNDFILAAKTNALLS